MSLSSWSIVFFIAQLAFYLSIYFAMFTPARVGKFFFAGGLWLVQLFVTLIYGMSTNQIGFIMLFFLEVAMIMFVYVVTGKMKYYEDNKSR